MNPRCLIIDDEPLAIKLIRSHLSKLESFEIAGECSNALKAIEFLRKEKIDLMFLDINLPEITGLEFLKSIPNPPYVIITTAYRDYAIEGYDLDVIDFLLKPISFERFLKAINRFYNRTRPIPENTSEPKDAARSKHIFVQDGKNIYKLSYDELLYLEGYGEYVKVICTSKTYLIRDSLTEFEQRLPEINFLRIHKSYIVNLEKITGFSSIHVLLKGTELPIGRIFREKVLSRLKSDITK
jgi:DNA-binding LytR/AlgR family response regulator